MDPDGTNVRGGSQAVGIDGEPAWSLDSKRIAYAQGEPGKAKLHSGCDLSLMLILHSVSRHSMEHSEQIVCGFTPSWSPDGHEKP